MITEIDIVPTPAFPKKHAETIAKNARHIGMIDVYGVSILEHPVGNELEIFLFVHDKPENLAAFAGFVSRKNGGVWQARNAASYGEYSGKNLVGKLYKFAKENLKKSLQSDNKQSWAGEQIWTKSLPKLGLSPMILDTTTEKIYDPKTSNIDVYSMEEPDRYIWILESRDSYPYQNITEGTWMMPLTGKWYLG